MNIQVDPTSSNRASAMLNSKIRPRAVVGYGVKIFNPSPPNYVTRSPGIGGVLARGTDNKFLEEDLSERVGLYSSSSSEARVRALFWRRSRVKDIFFTLHLSLVREHDDPLNSTCINE